MTGQPNKKIVVVDDDLSVQEVTRAYLERDGYLVYVAGTAGEGLALAERVEPGLIVLDLMLPDRAGEDVCREIRERSGLVDPAEAPASIELEGRRVFFCSRGCLGEYQVGAIYPYGV